MNARTVEKPDYVIDDTQQHILLLDDYDVIDDEIQSRVARRTRTILDFCKQTSLRILTLNAGLLGKKCCWLSSRQKRFVNRSKYLRLGSQYII